MINIMKVNDRLDNSIDITDILDESERGVYEEVLFAQHFSQEERRKALIYVRDTSVIFFRENKINFQSDDIEILKRYEEKYQEFVSKQLKSLDDSIGGLTYEKRSLMEYLYSITFNNKFSFESLETYVKYTIEEGDRRMKEWENSRQ